MFHDTTAVIFWSSLGLLIYAYALYPGLLWLAFTAIQMRRDLRYLQSPHERRSQSDMRAPRISLIIAAHDEAGRLAPQFAALRELNYPNWEAIYVTDGCQDATADEIRAVGDPRLSVLELDVRKGKANALNQGVRLASGELLVFTDAGTRLAPDCLWKLARHFQQPGVGVVCGLVNFDDQPGTVRTESRYWRFECALRLLESRLGVTLNAHGGLYAMRRNAYRHLKEDTLVDDLLLPWQVRAQGLRVIYDPEARCTDTWPDSVSGQVRRRRRLAQGSFRALRQVWNTPSDWITLWAFVSHKLLRWITPFLALLLLLSCLASLTHIASEVVLAGMAYMAVWAWLDSRRSRDGLIYYLLAMNLAFLQGCWRALWPSHDGTWERVR